MQIGIAGLGRMGAAIAARLIEVGHTLTVWNRSPEKAKPLETAGAALARSPGELAGKVETVITILTDAAAIEAVYDGSCAKSPRQGCRPGGMPGRRHGRAGPPRQAHRADGGRGRRCCARQADPRATLPPARARRTGRQRRLDEARHQPAAAGLLSGTRRGLGAVAQ